MQRLVYPPSIASSWPSKHSSAVFPRPLVLPPPAVGWVYTFPRSLHLPRQRTWNSSFVDHPDVQWVGLVLGGMRMDLTFPHFLNRLWPQPWISIQVGSFLGLGLFPQPRVGVSPGSTPKGFTFGPSLLPQSVAASSPSSFGSLALGLWVITPLDLGITQLGPSF